MTFTTADAELFFDTLDLFGGNTYGGADFTLSALGDDSTWGNPQPVDVWVSSQLRDGAVAYTQRYDNREMFLRVRVTATGADGLTAGEAALVEACGKRTTLEWTPPDNYAVTTVFSIETSNLEHIHDDVDERRHARTYGLRMVARPHTRSQDQITLSAIPDGVPFSETVIDEATSTTNWTAKYTLSLVSGQAVRSSVTLASGRPAPNATNWLKRTASFTMTDTYLRVKASTTAGELSLYIDGVLYEPVATSSIFSWYEVPAGTYSQVEVRASAAFSPSGTEWKVTVWSLYQTNTASLGTRRELQRSFSDIKGSVRAPGELKVSHPANGLGNVLAFVYPAGLGDYSPPLHPHRTAGGAITSDTSVVSGGREPINGTPATWVIPAAALPPGGYHFLANLRHTTTAGVYALTYTASVAGTTVTRNVKVTLDVANTWQIVSLGTEHLPPLRVKSDADRDVTITLAGPANVQLDTAWLFLANEYDAPTALIHVAAGAELSVSHQSPDSLMETPLVFVGDHAAGSAVKASGDPEFKPPRVRIYLVTTGTEDAEAELTYYPHWHTHAGL